MAVVSVNLSKTAQDEWDRIYKGRRSRVVSRYLETRSLDRVDPTLGKTGHELAEMVIELRQLIEEGHKHRDALRGQIAYHEGQKYLAKLEKAKAGEEE